MMDGVGHEGNHFHFDEAQRVWQSVDDDEEAVGWAELSSHSQPVMVSDAYAKTCTLSILFADLARQLLLDRVHDEDLHQQCINVIDTLERSQRVSEQQIAQMRVKYEAGAAAMANSLELAYRAGYRAVMFAIDQFAFTSGIPYREILELLAEQYPSVYTDFPKIEHDAHPFDRLERRAADHYHDLDASSPSYWKRLKNFCIANGKNYFPPLIWVPTYSLRTLLYDILAGLTVGVFLVPQGMAYAALAGLPVEIGLYASTIPVLVYALLGTSRQMAVGPFALIALLVNAALQSLPVPTGTEAQQAAFLLQASVDLMLYVGLVLTIFGILRLGFISNFISKSFLAGFTSASGLLIQTSQIPKFLGEKVPSGFSSQMFVIQWVQIVQGLPSINWVTLVTGIVTLIVVLFFQVFNKKYPIKIGPLKIPFPSALLVIIVGILVSFLADFDGKGVSVVGYIPPGFNALSLPTFNNFGNLFVNAIIIALIVYLSSAAITLKYSEQHDYDADPNQEQIAMGVANIVGSFFSGFVVSGAMSRSAVANDAGARSPVFGIATAIVVIIILVVATPVLFFLPSTCLSALILVAAYGLWDFMLLLDLWRIRKLDFIVWWVAFLCTLLIGASIGLLIALAFSIIVVVYQASTPHVAVLGRLPRSSVWRNVRRFPDAIVVSGLLVLRIDANFFFANVRFIHQTIIRLILAEPKRVYVLLLDLSPVGDIDFSAVTELQKTIKYLRARDTTLMATAVNGIVRDMLRKSGFIKLIGEENVFWLHQDAVKEAKKIINRKMEAARAARREQGLPPEDDDFATNVTLSHFGGPQRVFKSPERQKEHQSFWQKLI